MNKNTGLLKKRKMNLFTWILIGIFLAALVLNALTVPMADDLGYSISSGIIDIFKREYIQYMTWTGRSVAHIIARCFLAMPKTVFDICNSLCFVYLNWLIYCHVKADRNKDKPFLLLLIALFVFLFVPLFGQTCLWETGSCNYLWTTVIILQFLLPYRLQKESRNILYTGGMFLFGIVAGWTNENTAGALILLVLFFMVLSFKNKKMQGWMYAGLIGACIGFVLMIIAPGNAIRSADFVNTEGMAYTIVHDWNDAFSVLFSSSTSLRIPLLISMILLVLNTDKKERIVSAAYCFAGIAAVFALILTPVPVVFDRSVFGAAILIIISIGIGVYKFDQQPSAFTKKALNIGIAICMCFTVYHYALAISDLGYTRYQYLNREAYVADQKAAGNDNPVIPQINTEFATSYNAIYGLIDISEYPNLWVNKYYSQIHGLTTVQSTPLSQWNKIYKNGDPQMMTIQDMSIYLKALSEQPGYAALINCNTLNQDAYTEQIKALKQYGIDIEDNTNFIAVLQNNEVSMFESSMDSLEQYGSIEGHSYYISSNTAGDMSDILIDSIEYTNDNPGISIVVYDTQKQQVIDSVTWNAENEMFCTRYKIEK